MDKYILRFRRRTHLVENHDDNDNDSDNNINHNLSKGSHQ